MGSATNRHVSEEESDEYSFGLLPESEAARIEEHFLLCASCRDRITASDGYISLMQEAAAALRRMPQPETHPWYRPPFLTQLVAAAVLVFLMAFGLRFATRMPASTPIAVSLSATRGRGIEANAPAGQTLNLQLDLSGLAAEPSLRMEMVDAIGHRLWQGTVVPRGNQASASVSQLQPGTYFVRAYSPSGQLLREYGLTVSSH